ncbi:MAG: NAD-dependent epimerase/dehydratase family protein [Deltaproteobacteria bacterium]|nr:NAD-dependent epimerase/dehydratase family protein [Deltaproteobacteria bacterium]
MTTTTTALGRDHTVLVIGCGFLGKVIAQRLAFKGVPVLGTTRTQADLGVIRTRGAEPILFDGVDLAPLARVIKRVRSVVMSVPPGGPGGEGGSELDKKLVDMLAAAPLVSAVYVSSTSVYGDRGGAVTLEGDAVAPDGPKGRARLEAEAIWRAAPFPTAVIRPSGIYGPGRSLLHRMAAGKYRLVAGGAAITNRVHVADLASLVVRALERPRAGAIWLGSDLAPAPQREVIDWIGLLTGWPPPPEMSLAEARVRLDKDTLGMFVQSKRLDPSATLAELGVTLRYPSYREGLGDIWAKERTALDERKRQNLDAPGTIG